MQRLRVTSRRFHYDVVTGRGAWRALREVGAGKYSSVFVVTEAPLWSCWGQKFLRDTGLKNARTLFVPPGERSKSLKMVESLAAQLLAGGADRCSLLVALGGGVVGDLGGFLAASYMRGIDIVQAPTTIVGQVDSAIGGKTGVNVGAMKNLVGAFYPPRMVVCEPEVLTSMKARSYRSGLYEVVKHAILAGNPLFRNLESDLGKLRPQNIKLLEATLAVAAKVKVDVVSRDEREAKLRLVLNLGHTFGHALEEVTAYRRFTHGEAVGWGLLAVIRLAERLKMLGAAHAGRMSQLVGDVGPLPPIRDLEPQRVLGLLSQDKKSIGGRIHWVIPERIGRVQIVSDVPQKVAAAAFRDIQGISGTGERTA
jgi:3-dehydroquinate synthase